MDASQIIAMVAQYKQDGKDISVLMADLQTMSATGKTPLGLNQWQKSDKPTMDDFNSDNKLIDDSIRELQAKKVNVGVPEIHTLSFSENFTPLNYCYFFKSQEGVCTIQFCAKHSSPGMAIHLVIATLPVGYRPKNQMEVPVTYNAGEVVAGTVYIKSSGEIAIALGNSNASNVYMSCASFVAQ